MEKRTIHFVNTIPLSTHILRRALDKSLRLARIYPLHRPGWDFLIPWQHPIRAPHSISYHLLHAFRQVSNVRFFNMYEKGRIVLGPKDIFIGQPLPERGFVYEDRSGTDKSDSITSRTIRENSTNKNKFLILPFANDHRYIGWLQDLSLHADGLILVGGANWRRDLSTTPLGNLTGRKTLGLNMCINPSEYPVCKKAFNPPGRRKYLYVGHTGWYKNTVELERIAAAIPDFQGGHIGTGEIRGWKKISSFTSLTTEFMSDVSREYDIFVNTSSADPQATTILEHMCFGFAVACTPGSGYEYDSITQLSVADTNWNKEQLMRLQFETEDVLLERARKNRDYAIRFHNWPDFTKSIVRFIL